MKHYLILDNRMMIVGKTTDPTKEYEEHTFVELPKYLFDTLENWIIDTDMKDFVLNKCKKFQVVREPVLKEMTL